MRREIGGRAVGQGVPVFVVAEIGLNHDGSLERGLELVDAAAAAGADAVKLQTLRASGLVAPSCPAPQHVRAASLREFFARFELDAAAHRRLVARARERGLAVMTTPLDADALPMLETLGLDGYKIASGDLTYHALIQSVAATGRPVVLSTGMSDIGEVRAALTAAGGAVAAVLHCVSAYPTPACDENLGALVGLRALGQPVGLSDHGAGLESAVAAVALGAVMYERHLVLEGDDHAVDGPVSSTPTELRAIVNAVQRVRLALGDGVKRCRAAEAGNVVASRRGLYARRPLRAGETVTAADIAVLRPATAMAPSEAARLVGTRLSRDVPEGTAFEPEDVRARSAA